MKSGGRAAVAGCVSVAVALAGCASAPAPAPAAKRPSDIIPITAANLRGQESLYREGWFIVSSTEKAFAYAREHSIESSGSAMRQMGADIARHSAELGGGVAQAPSAGVQTGAKVLERGTALTKSELAFAHAAAQGELDYANRGMQRAWDRFVRGNLTLAERTESDRAALRSLPGGYFDRLGSDWSNLNELTDDAKKRMSTGIEARWGDAFGEARADFNRAYERSGTRSNSVAGLGDIFVGYVSALYSGVAKPTARAAVQGGEATAKVGTEVVFLPVTYAFIVTGRTVTSAGMSLYYTTATGVKLVSPTVEGGLLAGMSMLAYGAVPVTYAAGGALGAVNQVAVTTAAPVAGVGYATGSAAAETGVYAVQVSYDLATGVTKVTMNQAQAGVVLGYNALTALPTQAVLGAANGAVFLAWDGPRLVVAAARGEVQWSGDGGTRGSVPVQSLPVGAVVDLDQLRKEPGVTVETLSDDPQVVEKVLQKLPQDLRVPAKQPARVEGKP
jgi:hypothetical protein